MPGYILHLTAARMYLDLLPSTDPLKYNPIFQNDFFAGNLLPDAVEQKKESHFRDPSYRDYFIEWPHPEFFAHKYASLLNKPVCLGYYLHLYIDKIFFRDYLPQVAEYYDINNQITELRKNVHHVLLKKSGKKIPLKSYLSEEYYYGDYTRMNTWLMERFRLPEKLDPVLNPGIEEVDFRNLDNIMKQLASYQKMPSDAINDLKVFDIGHLTAFLQECCLTFPEILQHSHQ